ncbi:hypothetical protein D3C72_2006740 [compost metagenome]
MLCDGIASGQTIQMPASRKGGHPDWANRPAHLVCTSVNADAVLQHYRETVTR